MILFSRKMNQTEKSFPDPHAPGFQPADLWECGLELLAATQLSCVVLVKYGSHQSSAFDVTNFSMQFPLEKAKKNFIKRLELL